MFQYGVDSILGCCVIQNEYDEELLGNRVYSIQVLAESCLTQRLQYLERSVTWLLLMALPIDGDRKYDAEQLGLYLKVLLRTG